MKIESAEKRRKARRLWAYIAGYVRDLKGVLWLSIIQGALITEFMYMLTHPIRLFCRR